MRRYLAFDLETVEPFPDEGDWRDVRPLGIGCAAAYATDLNKPMAWFGRNEDGTIRERLTRDENARMVKQLLKLTKRNPQHPEKEPYTLLTWNGLGFDLDILAEESGLERECQQLALGHVDMMFHIYAKLGYPLGLGKAAKGMGTPGKPEGMDGEKANSMWREGDRKPVIDYCTQDVLATLALAETCMKRGYLSWTSNRGNRRIFEIEGEWMPVKRANNEPRPDTSWKPDARSSSPRPTGWCRTCSPPSATWRYRDNYESSTTTISCCALPHPNRYSTKVVASAKMLPKTREAATWAEASPRWRSRNLWRQSGTGTDRHPRRTKGGFSTNSPR